MKISLLAAALFGALGLGQAASAQEQSIRVSALSGWEAVGRLNMGNRAMCTGALIAPDKVLTAAHCLYDPQSGRRLKPSRIKFEAGMSRGRAIAARGVKQTIVHPDYRHNQVGSNGAGVDLALLTLDSPIAASEVRPFATDASPSKGDAVGVLSYTYSRKNSPLLQHPCDVVARTSAVLVMDCEVDFGASGAPVFAVQGGTRPKLVSVISSKAAMGGRPVSVGTLVDVALAALLARSG